jgi:hypothetical protein
VMDLSWSLNLKSGVCFVLGADDANLHYQMLTHLRGGSQLLIANGFFSKCCHVNACGAFKLKTDPLGLHTPVCVPRSIEALCELCPPSGSCSSTNTYAFKSDSQLRQIDQFGGAYFRDHQLKSIHVPRLVLTIGKACFESIMIKSLTFETGS